MKTCNECGFSYHESLSTCPECGAPNDMIATSTRRLSNCPNCGAPATNSLKCDYCDSLFPKQEDKPYQHTATQTSENENAAVGMGVAAFLGGIFGGLLGD